ncbi:hypothetical protein KPL71_001791 [Citrus sinensis]|uniref:Uncharacterized protein n=1 Tax=Citrus sinensis TaxID=2711 RepID=A0ACB8NZC3_CITSI|nr:hypothetical protein KPL71_001791 [Citrus sinensis]
MDPYGMALKWRPSRFLGLLSSTTCRVVGLQDGQWRLSNSRCSGHGRPSADPGIARKAITGEQTRSFEAKRCVWKHRSSRSGHRRKLRLYRAAALGKTKVLQILTEQVGDLRHHFYGNDDKTVLHMAVLGQHFDTAIWLLKHDSSLANKRTSKGPDGLTCLQLLALMPSAFKSYSKTADIWTSLVSSCLPTYDDDDCVDYNYKEDLETGKIDNRVACRKRTRASNGITEILKEIIHQHPQAILLDNLNEKEQNILHVSVKRRQYKVFELIMKDMRLSVPKWASRIDKKGYTLLHHVADMKHYKEGTRPGPVLQFQEELQLFEVSPLIIFNFVP